MKSASALSCLPAAPPRLGRRQRGARAGLAALDGFDGGADLAPLALVEHAGDHLPEVGLGLVVLAPLAAHPDPVHDAPAPERRQRHRRAARRDAEALLDLGLRQRLAREVEQAERAPHRAREAPELGDAPAGVDAEVARAAPARAGCRRREDIHARIGSDVGAGTSAIGAARRELPAGGVDVVAARRADVDRQAARAQALLKRADALGRRALERRAREGVPGDEVDLGRDPAQQAAAAGRRRRRCR